MMKYFSSKVLVSLVRTLLWKTLGTRSLVNEIFLKLVLCSHTPQSMILSPTCVVVLAGSETGYLSMVLLTLC